MVSQRKEKFRQGSEWIGVKTETEGQEPAVPITPPPFCGGFTTP